MEQMQGSWKNKKKGKRKWWLMWQLCHITFFCTCSKHKIDTTILILTFFRPENMYNMLQEDLAFARNKIPKI